MDAATPPAVLSTIEAFISRWQGQEGGQERANYALFLTELCDVLGLPHPIRRMPRTSATITCSSAW